MRPPDDAEVLALADLQAGAGLASWAAALLLLDPRLTPQTLDAMLLGARDGLLLDLHDALFGPYLDAVTECPACGAAMQAQVPVAALRHPAPPPQTLQVELAAGTARLRPVVAGDLAAAEAAGSAAAAERTLLERCVLDAPVPAALLAPEDVAAIAACLAEADPAADVQAALRCAICGTAWDAAVDAARFLRRRLDDRAAELLEEVHVLASAYHWSEAAILAMPRARRERYCALIGS